jgi:hypothetical protein
MKRELDSRLNTHGERITLVWYSDTDAVEIELADGEGTLRTAPVPAHRALDAFHHPYLYVDPTCLPHSLIAA